MDFFISNAYAADGAQPGADYLMPIMLVVFGLFFYFMIMRPQQKRAKAHRELMASISKGDEVLRDFITSVLPKGTMKSL